MVKRGDPGFSLENVERERIKTSREACLRTTINYPRVDVLEKRVRDFKPLPPVTLYQAPDGTLVLVDGWNRVVVYDRLGVSLIPALIIDTSLADALVAGLRQNLPQEGKLRSGSDAEHALNILATALGRQITVEEAACVGLAHTPNAPICPSMFNSLCLPQFPSPQPKPNSERKPGKFERSKKPKPPRGA
jgi:hypothetical protein